MTKDRRAPAGQDGAAEESTTAGERAPLGERVAATRLPGRLPAPLCAHEPVITTKPPTAPTVPASIAIPAARRSLRSPAPFLAGSAAGGHSPTVATSNPAPP